MKLLPEVPTQEMLKAMWEAVTPATGCVIMADVYDAVYRNAPSVEGEAVGVYNTRNGNFVIYNHKQIQNSFGLGMINLYTNPDPRVAELEAQVKTLTAERNTYRDACTEDSVLLAQVKVARDLCDTIIENHTSDKIFIHDQYAINVALSIKEKLGGE